MKEKDIYTFDENIFKIMEEEGALLTAGSPDTFNTMTIGWSSLGFLWRRNVITVYVRPSRYTYKFITENPIFTVSFFDKEYRDKLIYLGNHSGRDEDKVKKCNLTPFETKNSGVAFTEARLILVCKKLYEQDLNPEKIPQAVKDRFYLQKDYHRFFIGEIIQCLEKE
jgi:flavin reductase (DIM6/NTAB) family NADH-FMN oxidoreductase RutF